MNEGACAELAHRAGNLQEAMALVKDSGSVSLASTCLHDPKKHKKKKAKKPKKQKSDKQKSKANVRQSSTDFINICDSNLFTEWLEVRRKEKKKRKNKPGVGSNEEFPLMRNKNVKLSQRQKLKSKSVGAPDERGVCSGPVMPPVTTLTQNQKKHKKSVVFNLSPMLLEPKPESQCTSDDINSQDLFITQKTFSDPYIDLCSSTSAEEALESQGSAETRPEPQAYKKPSAKERVSTGPQHQSSPWKRSSPTASSATTQSFPQNYTQSCKKPQASIASLPWKQASPRLQCCVASCLKSSALKKPSQRHKPDASTQTENFFTSPFLATSLRFRQASTCTDEPMDLSLPNRPQRHQGKAAEGRRHTEPNVTDLTPSDDSDSRSKSKADLCQLKTVQTRLNESFFFKLKGEGDSPKPISPLMKFTGSVEKKKP